MRLFLVRTASLLGAALLAGCGDEAPPRARAPTTRAPATPSPAAKLGPYPLSQFVIKHDAFLAADEPRTVPAAEARFLRDDDEVYGIVVAAKARAYSVRMLSYHHVVNDVMAGTPVAVTY